MRIGGVELYLNRPLVLIGSTDPEPGELEIGERGVAASMSHVLVSTDVDVGLIPVRIWLDEKVGEGQTVFNGEVNLEDGRLAIGDHAGLWRFVMTLGRSGMVPLVVTVDQVGSASIIDIYTWSRNDTA